MTEANGKLDKLTRPILVGVLVIILLLVNALIFSKEQVVNNGTVMLLDLAPRDPRSLLQGDYMALRYRMAADIGRHSETLTEDGYAVVALDDHDVATFIRIYGDGQPLESNEHLLFYRKRHGVVKVASDAFYFQEQHGRYYQAARYGKIRVSEEGDAVLVGLVDSEFNVLRPPASNASGPGEK
ncbi:MAG: GDYXXLXY domain-containing protein [Gammaproteobacteria bacterium]|jgi:uncharacterized membrane-anchored protein